MKIALTTAFACLLLFFASTAQAKNYYFSSSTGNDSYTSTQAQSSSTPWKTLSKLNSFFVSITAGDSILFKRGDSFFGNIIVLKPGTAAAPIIFSAYGSGANPIITGFATLSSWLSVGNGVYQSNCSSCYINVNMVAINGAEKAMGRYPNSGYLAFQSHSGNTSITSSQLPASPTFTGGEVVIRKNHWIIDRNKITNQSGGTVSYTAASTYTNLDGNGFFIQNSPQTLDQLGEWYFNPTGKNLQVYFGSASPSSYTVKASAIDTLVTIMNKGYVIFNGLAFQGANMYTFCVGGSPGVSILNCKIDMSGVNAIFGVNQGVSSTNFKLQNSTINHTNNDAVYLPTEFLSASILGNIIKNTATTPGMGNSGDGAYQCINLSGNNCKVQNNEVDSSGYSGICFSGANVIIKNNTVNYYCLIKDDGGGIYTYRGSATAPTQAGSQITGNIVLNGIGNMDGLTNTFLEAEGLYTDGYSSGVSVINNTVANVANAGLFMNSNSGGVISGNLFFNNNIQVYINQYYPTGNPFTNLSMTNNIFFCKQPYQMAVEYNSRYGNLDATFTASNNYYVRPLNDNVKLVTNYTASGKTYWGGYTLPMWQTVYSKDINSKVSPLTIIPYVLSGMVGANKYTYGTFEGRTDLPYISASGAGLQATYDNTSKIDGAGSMKIAYSGAATTNLATVEVEGIGGTTSTKNYIFKFSSLGTTKPRIIGFYMQQVGSPYAKLTPTQYLSIPAARGDNQVMFSLPATAANAGVVMQLNSQDGALWLDNIQFYEATVSVTNPDSYILFAYNNSTAAKTITLANTYTDVTGKVYSGSTSLTPYSSIVLMIPGPGQGKIQQNPAKQTNGKPTIY